MEFAELKNKGEKELRELMAEKQAELHAIRIKERTRSLKQVHLVSAVKRDIARIQYMLAHIKQATAVSN